MLESQTPPGFGSKYSADVFGDVVVMCEERVCVSNPLWYGYGTRNISNRHVQPFIRGRLLCHHLATVFKRILSPEPTSAGVLLENDCLMLPGEILEQQHKRSS